MNTPTPTSASPTWSDLANAASLLVRYRKDPIRFCWEVLGLRLWPRQAQILQTVADRLATGRGGTVAVPTGHGVGKSCGLGAIVVWLLTVFRAVTVLTTAPTDRQVRKIAWREIRRLASRSRLRLNPPPLTLEWELESTRFALGLSTNEPGKFQGFHNELVVVIVDEACGVERKIFEAVGVSTSGASDLKILLGNPTDPDSHLFDVCAGRTGEDVDVIHISSEEAADWNDAQDEPIPGLVSRRWIEDRREEWGEDSAIFQARVLGKFPEESEDTLIRLAWAEAAVRRGEEPEEIDAVPVIGCDVARFGSDRTVWVVRKGRRIVHVESLDKGDLMHVAGRTVDIAKRFGAQAMRWSAENYID